MKLHIPYSLRTALLAACSFPVLQSTSYAASDGRYWVDAQGIKHTFEDITLSSDEWDKLETAGAREFTLQNFKRTVNSDDDYMNSDGGYSDGGVFGGALFIEVSNTMTISAKEVTISGNTLENTATEFPYADGGAMYIDCVNNDYYYGSGYGSPQQETNFVFSGSDKINITNNGVRVKPDPFYPDEPYVDGGAITIFGIAEMTIEETEYAVGKVLERHTSLEFKDNKAVTIRGNYATNGTSYILLAISTLDADVAFAAPEGGEIKCYDGLDIDGILWINTTKELKEQSSYTGTVTLSGEYAAEDIRKLKGKNATTEELEWSQAVIAEAIYVANGTLEIKDTFVNAGKDISWSAVEMDHLFYAGKKAEVHITNSKILTELYDSNAGYREDGGFGTEDVDSEGQYGSLSIANATLKGKNTFCADYVYAAGVWTFIVDSVNKNTSVLRIEFDNSKLFNKAAHIFDTTGATFDIQVVSSSLAKDTYKLLDFDASKGTWINPNAVTLSGLASGVIGSENTVYYTTSGTEFTLWFYYGGKPSVPAHRAATTLTWQASDGTWSNNAGNNAGVWSGTVSDLNYYDGDTVEFNKAANVTIEGVVLPKAVIISNTDGEVTFESSKNGQITGNTNLTKTGKGTLTLNLSNAYTGGTELKDGTIVVGDAYALGLGLVKLSGGTLELNNHEVSNDIHLIGDASIHSTAYIGSLVLESGTLSGAVSGEGSMIKVGNDTATLEGTIALNGGASVESGELKLKTGSFTGSLMVNGGKLTIADGYEFNGQLTLNVSSETIAENTISVSLGNELILAGGKLKGDVSLNDGTLRVQATSYTVEGNVTLSGGDVYLDATLKIEGKLSTTAKTNIHLNVNHLIETGGANGSRTDCFTAQDTANVDTSHIELPELQGARIENGIDNNTVWVWLKNENLTWTSDTKGNWGVGEQTEWVNDKAEDKRFYNLDLVTFESAGEVNIVGEVNPGDIKVQGKENTTFSGDGHITGQATLTKEGEGKLTIATDNTDYIGKIIVNSGTLEVGHSKALGKSLVTINNATFDGGNFNDISSTIVFNGKSHISRADGATSVMLANHSNVSGDYTLSSGNTVTIGNEGATFSGNFTFAGGTLALTGATFHLLGDVMFTSGMEKSVDKLTAIDLRGWVGLTSGTYVLATLVTEEDAARYFTLSGMSESLARRAILEYVDGVLLLTINNAQINADVYSALNSNQKSVYNALATIAAQPIPPTGELAQVVEAVLSEDNPNTARALLDQLNGTELATAMTSQIEGNLSHLRRLRSHIGSGHTLTKEGDCAAYISGYDDVHRISADNNGAGIRRNEWGGMVGFEYAADKSLLVGISLNNGRTKVNPSSGSSYKGDDTRVDLYVSTELDDNLHSVTSMGFGLHDIKTTRKLPGTLKAHSDIDGFSFNFQQELAYTLKLSKESSILPFLSVESSYNTIDGFAESGAGTASLKGSKRESWATDITLGTRYIYSFISEGKRGYVSIEAGLLTSVGDTSADLNLRFAGAEKVSFRTAAADRNRLGCRLGAEILLPISEDISISTSVNSVLRGDANEYGASLGLKFNF